MRSRKRLRPSAPSIQSRSMDGISHNTRAMRPRAVWLADLPSIRNWRGWPSSDQISISWSWCRECRIPVTFQPRDSGRRAMSCAAARRKPRPGENSETASRILVLPAPLGPWMATGRASRSSRADLCERKCDRVRDVRCRPVIQKTPFSAQKTVQKMRIFWTGIFANSGAPSHPHGHDDIDRGRVVALAHQRRVTGGIEQENRILAIDLAGDFQKVFGVEADLEMFIAIGHGQFLLGRTAVRGIDGQHQTILVERKFDRPRTFRTDGCHPVHGPREF